MNANRAAVGEILAPKQMAQLVSSTVSLTVLWYFFLCWGLAPLINVRFQQCSLLTKVSPALWWLNHYFVKVVHIFKSFLNSTGALHIAGRQSSHSHSVRKPREGPQRRALFLSTLVQLPADQGPWSGYALAQTPSVAPYDLHDKV